MKKLLILALLVAGCDYAPTEHTHDDEIKEVSMLLVSYQNYSNKLYYTDHSTFIAKSYTPTDDDWITTVDGEGWCGNYGTMDSYIIIDGDTTCYSSTAEQVDRIFHYTQHNYFLIDAYETEFIFDCDYDNCPEWRFIYEYK